MNQGYLDVEVESYLISKLKWKGILDVKVVGIQ
jgi:hypothetical protein